MIDPSYDMVRMNELLAAVREETICDDQIHELDALLCSNIEAQKHYVDYMLLCVELRKCCSEGAVSMIEEDEPTTASLLAEVMIQQQAAAELRQVEQADLDADRLRASAERRQYLAMINGRSVPAKPIKRIVIPKAVFYGAIAAVVALTALLFWPTQSPSRQVVEDKPTASQFVQVATLVEQTDAYWLGQQQQIVPGQAILNQSMHLTSGLVKIRFNNEAEVILEAPCSIEPISGGEIKITHGKLVGRCETANSLGFVVQTPGARIIDLGTEFGVSVDQQGIAQAHVFEGEIELTTASITSPIKLQQDQARQVNAVGTSISAIEADQYTFIRGMQPQDRDPNRAYVDTVKQSQPLVYWRFEEDAGQFRNHGELSLMDLSTHRIGVVQDGALSTRSKALRFDGQRSRAAMPYHAQLDLATHFTIEAWVRLPDIQPARNRILTSRRILSQPGPGVIRETGFGLGTIDRINKDGQWVSRDLLFTHFGVMDYLVESNFNLNQWVHLVVVIDEVGRPRFYVDGDLILSDLNVKYDRNLSSKSINDMNQVMATRPPANGILLGVNPDTHMGEERFRGDLDELAIYARSLSEQEIKRHYRAGVESAAR